MHAHTHIHTYVFVYTHIIYVHTFLYVLKYVFFKVFVGVLASTTHYLECGALYYALFTRASKLNNALKYSIHIYCSFNSVSKNVKNLTIKTSQDADTRLWS